MSTGATRPWIASHKLYVQRSAEEEAKLRTEYQALFELFSREMKARLPALFLNEKLQPPPFHPTQSKGAWLEKFIRWSIRENHLNEAQAGDFADAARVIFTPRAEEFPIVSLKSGVPSSRCLRYLKGMAH